MARYGKRNVSMYYFVRMLNRRIEELQTLRDIALAARALVERIRELEGDVPDSALLTGAYGPELKQLIETLKVWEEAQQA